MKVLSVLQPWASLVVMGKKTIETRSWSTNYRGPLLIHAGLRKAGSFINQKSSVSQFISSFKNLPYGAIIGQINLENVFRLNDFQSTYTIKEIDNMTLEENVFGNNNMNRYGWLFKNAIQFDEPIAAKGSLRLWEFEF